MAEDKQKKLDEMDAMLAELGLGANAPVPANLHQHSAQSAINNGASRGPGPMKSGMSSGPGAAALAARKAAAGGGVSSGPGPMNLATHTPDGRALTFTGPPCAACKNMIIGQVTNALDQQWHPQCFVCTNCKRPFKGGNIVDNEGAPYCDECYDNMFCPKCATCLKPVTDKCIKAAGKIYHPEHFSCAQCGTDLRGKQYKEEDGEPYCMVCRGDRSLVLNPSAGICAKCKKPIIGEYITIQGQRMHPEHFRCEECGCEFRGGNCHEYEGKLYCYPDYLKLLKSICAHCQKPIIGRSVTAMGKVWHPEHFLCATCKEYLPEHRFYEHLGKPYCELHYMQFSKVCNTCNKPILTNGIAALGKHFHEQCFVCSGCSKALGKEIYDFESKALCKSCYNNLPKEVRKRLEKKKEGERKAQKGREKDAMKERKKEAGK